MRRKRNLKVTPSTGNVFRDLGFSSEESEHLLVRADLLLQLQKTLAARALTQVRAAELLHVTRPRVSDLLRGRIDLFSTESLIDMLARLGVRVRFVLKSARGRVASSARGSRAVGNVRRPTRRIDYSDIPEASAEQLKGMQRVRAAGGRHSRQGPAAELRLTRRK
jgi:predicted XRE-type DNA-binding protein